MWVSKLSWAYYYYYSIFPWSTFGWEINYLPKVQSFIIPNRNTLAFDICFLRTNFEELCLYRYRAMPWCECGLEFLSCYQHKPFESPAHLEVKRPLWKKCKIPFRIVRLPTLVACCQPLYWLVSRGGCQNWAGRGRTPGWGEQKWGGRQINSGKRTVSGAVATSILNFPSCPPFGYLIYLPRFTGTGLSRSGRATRAYPQQGTSIPLLRG